MNLESAWSRERTDGIYIRTQVNFTAGFPKGLQINSDSQLKLVLFPAVMFYTHCSSDIAIDPLHHGSKKETQSCVDYSGLPSTSAPLIYKS